MSTRTVLSLDEFMRLPETTEKQELDEGELITVPPPKLQHALTVKALYDQILAHLLVRQMAGAPLGQVFQETAYLLKRVDGEDTVRVPDVSYINDNRAQRTARDQYMEGAPVLAIEVVSPTDTAEMLARKVSQYLVAGSILVWIVYPENREVHVFSSPEAGERESRILDEEDILDAPELFPGWEGILLRDLFR